MASKPQWVRSGAGSGSGGCGSDGGQLAVAKQGLDGEGDGRGGRLVEGRSLGQGAGDDAIAVGIVDPQGRAAVGLRNPYGGVERELGGLGAGARRRVGHGRTCRRGDGDELDSPRRQRDVDRLVERRRDLEEPEAPGVGLGVGWSRRAERHRDSNRDRPHFASVSTRRFRL
jgi:hypothetical protein